MTNSPDDTIAYELHNLSTALVAITSLLEKTKADTKAHEFYSTIEQAMIALQYAMNENRMMHRAYSQMVARVEILERLLIMHLPAQPMLTHDIINKLKNA